MAHLESIDSMFHMLQVTAGHAEGLGNRPASMSVDRPDAGMCLCSALDVCEMLTTAHL